MAADPNVCNIRMRGSIILLDRNGNLFSLFNGIIVSAMIGKKIYKWRQQKGWSQGQLAMALGKTQSYVSQIESGKVPKGITGLRRLSNITGLSIDELSPEQ